MVTVVVVKVKSELHLWQMWEEGFEIFFIMASTAENHLTDVIEYIALQRESCI